MEAYCKKIRNEHEEEYYQLGFKAGQADGYHEGFPDGVKDGYKAGMEEERGGGTNAITYLEGLQEGEKRGRKEVTDWIDEVKGEEDYTDSEYHRRTSILLDKEVLQAQCKKWGIK